LNNSEQFLYTATDARSGEGSLVPQVPLTLEYHTRQVTSLGLLDTGASVNVLPHGLGIRLGATLDKNGPPITLTGNLAQYGARPLVVYASIGVFPPVPVGFCLDRGNRRTIDTGPGEFLYGIRCVLLSCTKGLRGATQELEEPAYTLRSLDATNSALTPFPRPDRRRGGAERRPDGRITVSHLVWLTHPTLPGYEYQE
jgi:hypothetical protein